MTFRRRDLLRGLGAGATLLLPFAREVSAAEAPSAGRFAFFFTPNGHYRKLFGADGAGTSFTFRPSLAALEPHKKDVTVISGLCLKSTSLKSSHEEIVRLLVCVTGDPGQSRAYGPSLDYVIAKQFGERPLTLAADPQRADPTWNTKLSFSGNDAVNAHVKDPQAVFKDLFGSLVPSQSPAQLQEAWAREKSLLDFVKEDLSLFSGRLGGADKAKLDLHLDAVRQIERDVVARQTLQASPACTNQIGKLALGEPPPADQVLLLRQQARFMIDLVAVAFACGMRRAATLLMQGASAGVNVSGFGIAGDHHEVSHYQVAKSTEQWPVIDAWYAEQFAYFVGRLRELGALDRTVLVWGTEISEEHNQNNMTYLVAGGGALGIKTGRHLALPFVGKESGLSEVGKDPRNASLADLWVTVQRACGVDRTTFGDPQHCTGGLPGLT